MSEKVLEIRSSSKKYDVQITPDIEAIRQLFVLPDAFFVIDKTVYRFYQKLFCSIPTERFFLLDAMEEKKTLEIALDICERMMALDAKRNAVLVSFGGGITQDVTGFAANILYRGIHWIFVPTTLLAACDSCIGGKTSLNYKTYKNLLGTFFPPDEILIHTPFFKTLSRRDFLSGLGEVVKFNVMQNEQVLEELEAAMPLLLAADPQTINRFVVSSLKFKRPFIEDDEFDRGERIKLNFAHTFGHAYEVASAYEIPHGMAVSMGTITANHLSVKRGLLSQERAKRIETLIRPVIDSKTQTVNFNFDTILSAIHKDKKQIDNQITAVLLDENFDLSIVHDVKAEEVEEAVAYLLAFLK